jgi:hypothetical protein
MTATREYVITLWGLNHNGLHPSWRLSGKEQEKKKKKRKKKKRALRYLGAQAPPHKRNNTYVRIRLTYSMTITSSHNLHSHSPFTRISLNARHASSQLYQVYNVLPPRKCVFPCRCSLSSSFVSPSYPLQGESLPNVLFAMLFVHLQTSGEL